MPLSRGVALRKRLATRSRSLTDLEARSASRSSPDATAPTEVEVAGVVDRVLFHRPDTGYTVLRLKSANRATSILVGVLPEPREGEFVRARGTWDEDRAWGRRLLVSRFELAPPTTSEALIDFLSSGIVAGLGPKTAERIVGHFGLELGEVLERSPERLAEVPGLRRDIAQRLVEAWRSQREGRELLLFLHAHGIGLARARAVLNAWGRDALARVKSDPYALARDVPGIGFATADRLARKLGIQEDAPVRLIAALEEALRRAAEEGHTAVAQAELLGTARALLGDGGPALEAALEMALERGLLCVTSRDDTRWLQLPHLANAEAAIARELERLLAAPLGWCFVDPAATATRAAAKLGLELAAGQRAALLAALTNKVLIVTGGPGTGKTTLVRAILNAFEEPGLRVVLAAPTGRAARRLAESTGCAASTLHRLLEAEPGRGFRRHRGRPLACDLVVVDEMSMVDTVLMRALLEALPDGAGLVLVGDADQLPSVGPGQVLADLIAAQVVPIATLNEIFRQAAQSGIVRNAHRINRGQLPEFARSDDAGADFFGIRVRDPEKLAERVVELAARRIPERFKMDPFDDVQVLSPVNRGPTGVRALNQHLQYALNPEPLAAIERAGARLGVGDKVMQLVNDYERDVYNGDLGRIAAIDRATGTVEVVFDERRLSYSFEELDALAPAFAATVHKAQGSEYPAVILTLARAHGRMLNRRLVYTAVTRARRLVVIAYEPGALERAVREGGGPTRQTLLVHRLAALRAGRTQRSKDGT